MNGPLGEPPDPDELFELIQEVEAEAADFDPDDLPPSQQLLVDDLEAAGAPDKMLERTRRGWYHDYASEHPFPKALLVNDANQVGLREIAERAKRGDYDP